MGRSGEQGPSSPPGLRCDTNLQRLRNRSFAGPFTGARFTDEVMRVPLFARALAGLAGAAHIAAPRLLWLPQDLDGPGVDLQVSVPAFTIVGVVALVGAALAGRFPTIGTTLLTTGAVVSTFGTVWAFEPVVALLSIPLLVAAALLLLGRGEPIRPVAGRRALLGAFAVGGYVVWRMLATFEERSRPNTPESSVTKPRWAADWLWVGGVRPDRARVTAAGLSSARQRCTYWADGEERRWVEAIPDRAGVARFELPDLQPGTRHHYRVDRADGVASTGAADATFRTPPAEAHDVTIAFGSCAWTGSNGAVFDAIRAVEPSVFVHLGDLHYGNLTSPRPDDHLALMTRALSTPAQSALFSSVPSAWVWDDHDFGPNDSDSSSPSRDAALRNYRRTVPDWGVQTDPDAPITQAFTIGRVRVVITDTRSQRTPSTMLGADQEAWLIDELVTSARSHALVVWANPSPWNVPDRPGSDQWGGFPHERRRIANAIADAQISNLVMISGDWHLAAIDDGTNTDFSDAGTGGFPLIHGAPFDRPGARTGETYSHGVFSNAGQFGSVCVADDGGNRVQVTLTCHLWTGEELGAHSFTVDV